MTHLPAGVEVADFAWWRWWHTVPVVAYVLVVSRAVAAIAWPEDLGSHPIARPPIAGRPGAPDRWCAGPSDSRVSWLRLARRGVWSCRRRCRSGGGSAYRFCDFRGGCPFNGRGARPYCALVCAREVIEKKGRFPPPWSVEELEACFWLLWTLK